jgi:transposase-like protein
MNRLFQSTVNYSSRKKYGKKEKAKMIVDGYRSIQLNLQNASVSDLIKEVASIYGVHHVTLRYWIKHYEEWLHNPLHSHICINGVKSDITKYELYRGE